jgi:thiamine-monophosphate kinase
MAATIGRMGEDAIIELFARGGPPAGDEVTIPNGDDAAAYRPRPGRVQVVTTDCQTDGVHFVRGTTPPRAVGWKLMAVNLSDLAAMGARPRYALLSVVLPRELSAEWLAEVALGVHEAAAEFDVVILGGNVSRSDRALVLDATLIGDADAAHLVRRSGAQPGDDIWVSGELGGPAAALARIDAEGVPAEDDPDFPLARRLFRPAPRVGLGAALAAGDLARSMCDVSDGLARDLSHLLAEGQGCRIARPELPGSPALFALAARLGVDPLPWLAGGGEEYELLFTSDPSRRAAIVQAALAAGVAVSRIGAVTPPGPRELVDADGAITTLEGGFDHFAAGESDET